MPANSIVVPARFTVRLFRRGVFLGLLTLAISLSIVSFLTACICDDPLYYLRKDEIKPAPTSSDSNISFPSDLPVNQPSNAKKDN
jgi:hypothetical protein